MLDKQDVQFLRVSFVGPRSVRLRPLLILLLVVRVRVRADVGRLVVQANCLRESRAKVDRSKLLALATFYYGRGGSVANAYSVGDHEDNVFRG